MRTQFSKFAQVAGIMLALAFTFSCSSGDDDEGGGGGSGGGTAACKSITEFNEPINGKRTGEFCEEASEKRVKALTDKYNSKHNEKISISEFKENQWKSECEDPEYAEKGKYYDSCPAGYALKCRDDDELYTTYYLYGDEFKGVNCDEFSEKWGFVYGGDVSSSSGGNGGGTSSSSGGVTGACTAANNTDTKYCSNGTLKQYDSMTDNGGRTYKTVVIGTQTWMAENLNYDDPDNDTDLCYDKDPANCTKYGRLYDWETAMAVCPSGWRIPSDVDWNILMKFVNPSCSDNDDCNGAGTALKATSGWKGGDNWSGNGQDVYGFSALPGGQGESYGYGNFINVGDIGYWWSDYAPDDGNSYAYTREIGSEKNRVYWSPYDKRIKLNSVRCLKDD